VSDREEGRSIEDYVIKVTDCLFWSRGHKGDEFKEKLKEWWGRTQTLKC